MNFEEAIKKIEEIVKRLEEEELPLEKAMELYEEGMLLIEKCEKVLDEAKLKVQIIKKQGEGKFSLENFEPTVKNSLAEKIDE